MAGADENDGKREAARAKAALAPTLEAAAAILPLVARPPSPRFPPKLAERWRETSRRLQAAWQSRHGMGLEDFRPAVFALCATALELADTDCLRLAEAFATASDRLDDVANLGNARLVAALTAGVECLNEPGGLENPAFVQRARQLAQRLEQCAAAPQTPGPRSATLDRLFVDEAVEYVDRLQEALATLPTDAYGAQEAAWGLTHLAEPLELDGIINIARRLIALFDAGNNHPDDFDSEQFRLAARNLVDKLRVAVGDVAPQ